MLLTIASCRYGQRGAEPYRQNGLGIKKELLTVKKLASELRIRMKSIQRAYRNGEIPIVGFCRMIRFDLDQIRNVVKQDGVHPILRFVLQFVEKLVPPIRIERTTNGLGM